MRQIVGDYSVLVEMKSLEGAPLGNSASPKAMALHILEDNSVSVDVLDIGFGVGGLGRLLKQSNQASHWSVDGIDGWEANCMNKSLFDEKIYRNIWHGLAQELPSEVVSGYKIICLLDVIEHLDAETAKWLLRSLLTSMGSDSFLFVSTPLWYYPQDQQQDGDLEEHLIGVPITSMMALLPLFYSISHPLVGGFVYGKKSLDYMDFFQPTANKKFSYEQGFNIVKCLNLPFNHGVIYKTGI